MTIANRLGEYDGQFEQGQFDGCSKEHKPDYGLCGQAEPASYTFNGLSNVMTYEITCDSCRSVSRDGQMHAGRFTCQECLDGQQRAIAKLDAADVPPEAVEFAAQALIEDEGDCGLCSMAKSDCVCVRDTCDGYHLPPLRDVVERHLMQVIESGTLIDKDDVVVTRRYAEYYPYTVTNLLFHDRPETYAQYWTTSDSNYDKLRSAVSLLVIEIIDGKQ